MATKHNGVTRPSAGIETRGLDDKGRLMIPARWRGDIGKEVYIAPSTEGGLMLMSQREFSELRARVAALDVTPEKKGDFKRHLDYNSDVSVVDVQGRMTIKEEMLNRAGLTTKSTIVLKIRELGIEVFSEERWKQVRDRHQAPYIDIGRMAGI
jgi:MraZ protein